MEKQTNFFSQRSQPSQPFTLAIEGKWKLKRNCSPLCGFLCSISFDQKSNPFCKLYTSVTRQTVVIINRVKHQLVEISINRASEACVLTCTQAQFRLSVAFNDCAFHYSINEPSRSGLRRHLTSNFEDIGWNPHIASYIVPCSK